MEALTYQLHVDLGHVAVAAKVGFMAQRYNSCPQSFKLRPGWWPCQGRWQGGCNNFCQALWRICSFALSALSQAAPSPALRHKRWCWKIYISSRCRDPQITMSMRSSRPLVCPMTFSDAQSVVVAKRSFTKVLVAEARFKGLSGADAFV